MLLLVKYWLGTATVCGFPCPGHVCINSRPWGCVCIICPQFFVVLTSNQPIPRHGTAFTGSCFCIRQAHILSLSDSWRPTLPSSGGLKGRGIKRGNGKLFSKLVTLSHIDARYEKQEAWHENCFEIAKESEKPPQPLATIPVHHSTASSLWVFLEGAKLFLVTPRSSNTIHSTYPTLPHVSFSWSGNAKVLSLSLTAWQWRTAGNLLRALPKGQCYLAHGVCNLKAFCIMVTMVDNDLSSVLRLKT